MDISDAIIDVMLWARGLPEAMKVLILAVFAIYGAVFGSFITVCADRIPKGESIVRPGSRCACGKPIKWRDNIPMISWLMLGGRARCCGRRIPLIYPLTELAMALAWLAPAAVFLYGSHPIFDAFAMLALLIGAPVACYAFTTNVYKK